jgi:hypothetical protein
MCRFSDRVWSCSEIVPETLWDRWKSERLGRKIYKNELALTHIENIKNGSIEMVVLRETEMSL